MAQTAGANIASGIGFKANRIVPDLRSAQMVQTLFQAKLDATPAGVEPVNNRIQHRYVHAATRALRQSFVSKAPPVYL